MTTYSGKFESLLSLLQPRYGIKVAFKDKSILMKIIAVILYPFNPKFMTGFATTIGKTVYFPSLDYINKYDKDATYVLAHETVHIYDSKHLLWLGSIGYNLGYLFPQILALLASFSLLAIWWTNLWMFSLLFLAFLFPMPAYFRMKIECRAYNLSRFLWNKEQHPISTKAYIIVISGLNYYCLYSEVGRNKWMERFDAYEKQLVGKHPVFIDVAYWCSCVDKTK